MGSNPSGKVRIVARIRGQSKKEVETLDGVSISKPWVSVSRPGENSNSLSLGRVKISFGSNKTTSVKQCYEMDECYEQDVGTEDIFSREIKPLISGLFEGQTCTVFAYGPRGSGKTYTIQGCKEKVGLITFAMDSILPRAEEEGKAITISVVEVQQERVFDLLDSKRLEVSVFEDTQGKIRLKGLSKVKVTSTSEFQKLYSHAVSSQKPLQKLMIEPQYRSHIGCIVHIVSPQTENSNAQLVGKINFVDLASYEDSRRKSSDGLGLSEITRINKSLYAVHNVLYALNANEARVPYRESKLTRMLQDSLGGKNKILMVACLNPSFCQETLQTMSLASRSCLASYFAYVDPAKSSKSATKTIRMSSPQVLKPPSRSAVRTNILSPKVVKPISASASGKKHTGSLSRLSTKKSSSVALEAKGRKLLFDQTNQLKTSKQGNIEGASTIESSAKVEENVTLKTKATVESSTLEKENVTQKTEATVESSTLEEGNASVRTEATVESSIQEEEKSAVEASLDMDSSQMPPEVDDVPQVEFNNLTATPPITYQTPTTADFLREGADKENKSLLICNGASPPLSARLRELSNNLKSLCISSESSLKMAHECSTRYDQVIHENLEPKTPIILRSLKADGKHETPNLKSPWENFHMRGSGMKDSLVQECLKFLNTASKEELKVLKGIGEKRATYILEMRDESPEPFKKLDDLQEIGLSAKQVKVMIKKVAGDLFT